VVRENIKTLTATVVAIDHAKRLVSLKGPKGNVVELKVGEEVRNLPQVSVGDHVQVRFYESIAAQLAKPGTPLGATLQEAAGRAKPGDMPAGAAARQVTVVALIEKIDKKSQTVTLKGPEGGTTDVKVARPQMLEKVKVGDEVAITYTEALAISVEKAVKK
jgi:Cu/Ag efflux protein CusF